MANATFRKGVLWLSVSAVTLAAVVGASMAQQPLTKEEIERLKAKQQQKAAPQGQVQQPIVKGPPPLKQVVPPVIKREQPPIVKRELSPVTKQPPPPPLKVVTPPPPPLKQVTPPPPPPLKQVTPPLKQVTPPPTGFTKGTPTPLKQVTPPPTGLSKEVPPPLKQVTPPNVKGTVNVPAIPATGVPKTAIVPPPPPDKKTGFGGAVVPGATGTQGAPKIRPIGVAPTVPVGAKPVAITPLAGPQKLDQLKSERVQRTDNKGRTLFVEPGNRTIIKQDNRFIIHRDEGKRFQAFRPDARTMRLPNGITQSVYIRPDGVRVYSEFDGAGRLIRRYSRGPGGRDVVYLDNRRFYRNLAIGVGIGAVGVGLALALSPPAHALPRPKYIVEYDSASDDDLYEALTAPPVVRLERSYSLDEIRYSQPLRERMRRIDIDAITFDTGSFEVSEEQYGKLERMAKAIAKAIEKNPAEMFLIEGHTDAVGPDDDNLTLSDRRAEAVSRVLSEYYNIPIENIVTQGYGEQNLKIDTQGPERGNRRVSFRRIGPLLNQESSGG